MSNISEKAKEILRKSRENKTNIINVMHMDTAPHDRIRIGKSELDGDYKGALAELFTKHYIKATKKDEYLIVKK